MISPYWQPAFEAEAKEWCKSYPRDEAALTGSISEHCHGTARGSLSRLLWF